MRGKGMGGHERAYTGFTNEWLTPPEIITALGPFDLDPCSPVNRPWPTAAQHYTREDDGLAQPWKGFVWCNPPYGPQAARWLRKLADHGDGIALVFARTETAAFHHYCWGKADAMLFLKGRLHFHWADGERAQFNAGAPSVLVAYGSRGANRLRQGGISGKFILLQGR